MNFVPRFIEVLGKWETCQLKAYLDTDGTWHIGFGHGNANNLPPFVDAHTVIKDRDEAMSILLNDLHQVYVPQLDALFRTIDFHAPNDFYYSGFLDAGYNRGMGRVRQSVAYDWLKKPNEKNFMKQAAKGLVFSHVDGFTPLDTTDTPGPDGSHVRLGLTLRRIDDSSMCLTQL